MWINKLKFNVSLLIKRFQFNWETWRKSREIAQAYGERKIFTMRAFISVALIVMLSLGVIGIVYTAVQHGQDIVFVAQKTARGINFIFMRRIAEPAQEAIRALRNFSENAMKKAPAPVAKGEKSVKNETPALPAQGVKDTQKPPPAVASVPAASMPPEQQKTMEYDTSVTIGLTKNFSITMNFCILANKAERMLYLLKKNDVDNTWKTIERFPVLVGRNEGQKMTAGDQRTPEGTYFIVGRRESEELNAIYGPLAYMLNYPNEEDRKAGRTGQGIWIHGTREDTTREATRGCVVLNNADMLSLSRYLQLGIGTPVVIINANGLTVPEQALNFTQLRALRKRILVEYNSRRTEFEALLMQWKQAWESRDIENYSRFYDHDRFFGEGMRWDAWREKKQRIFQAYSAISVGLDKISVSEFSESTAVILFMQRYESNVLRLQRPKKLSFYKSDGQWKIFKEETYSKQELLL